MKPFFTLLCVWIFAFQSVAQVNIRGRWNPKDTTQTHILHTKRGDEFTTGRMLSRNKTVVAYLLDSDTLFFATKQVSWVQVVKPSKRLPPTFLRERLFLSPTAFPLEKGVREYRNNTLLFNSYRKGITNNLQMGFGFMPGLLVNLLWVDTKITIPVSNNFRAGIGGMLGGGNYFDFYDSYQGLGFAAGYGVVSIGSRYHFINLSAAYAGGKTGNNLDGANRSRKTNSWIFSTGGAFKIGKKENRLFFEILSIPVEGSRQLVRGGAIGVTIATKGKRHLDLVTSMPIPGSFAIGVTSKK